MARAVKTKKIRKKRIKETEKNLRKQLRGSGLSRKEARKQAGATAEDVYEAGRQKTLAENAAKRAENQAKREAYFKKGEESQAKLKQSKSDPSKNSGGSGLPSAEEVKRKQEEMKQFREESKKSDIRTARGKANISAARQAKPGEAYTRINPDGTTKKVVKIDPSKKNQPKSSVQQSSTQPKSSVQQSSPKVKSDKQKFGEFSRTQYGKEKKTYTSKPGESEEDFKKRILPEMKKNRAKHGGALAIMIAPVKTKKMKAVKKGAHGAKVKEAMYGAKMKKAEMGGKLKEVPSDNKGLGKLPKKVRNKMGYMKNGGKVTDPKKGKMVRQKPKTDPNINPATGLYYSKSGGAEGNKSRGTKMMYGGSMKKAMYGAKMKKMENGGKVKKRTTTVTENTPSVYSKFTDAQKSEIKARRKKLTGEDKKDFDYDLARTKDTKSKTTTTTKRRSGKVKSQSVTEKRKSSIPGRSTDVTTTSKKRRGGSTRVKITSYGAGDDRDAGRVVKQKFSRKGRLKKTKVLKAMYGAKMKKKAMYGAKMKK